MGNKTRYVLNDLIQCHLWMNSFSLFCLRPHIWQSVWHQTFLWCNIFYDGAALRVHELLMNAPRKLHLLISPLSRVNLDQEKQRYIWFVRIVGMSTCLPNHWHVQHCNLDSTLQFLQSHFFFFLFLSRTPREFRSGSFSASVDINLLSSISVRQQSDYSQRLSAWIRLSFRDTIAECHWPMAWSPVCVSERNILLLFCDNV